MHYNGEQILKDIKNITLKNKVKTLSYDVNSLDDCMCEIDLHLPIIDKDMADLIESYYEYAPYNKLNFPLPQVLLYDIGDYCHIGNYTFFHFYSTFVHNDMLLVYKENDLILLRLNNLLLNNIQQYTVYTN